MFVSSYSSYLLLLQSRSLSLFHSMEFVVSKYFFKFICIDVQVIKRPGREGRSWGHSAEARKQGYFGTFRCADFENRCWSSRFYGILRKFDVKFDVIVTHGALTQVRVRAPCSDIMILPDLLMRAKNYFSNIDILLYMERKFYA